MNVKKSGEGMAGVYREIAEITNEDTAVLLFHNFRGQQVVFPNKLYASSYTAQRIREEYDGKNVRDLALKYGFTEKWVRTILKQK